MTKKSRIPHPLVLVYLILLLVAVLTHFVPTSVATMNEETGVNEITYNASFDEEGNIVTDAGPSPKGLWDVVLAPIRGFSNAADVSIAILVSGAFLNIMAHVGALDAGIGKLLSKFKGSTLIALLMFVFALMGTVYGAWEEMPAYAIVMIPLFVTAGYDAITGVMVVLAGANAGNMASVVNPYATGAAVASIGNPDLSLGDGFMLRAILFIVFYLMSTFFVIRYANSVKANKEKSVLYGVEGINTRVSEKSELPELTPRRVWSLVVFGLMILTTVMGYFPWDSFSQTAFDIVNTPFTATANIPVLGNILGSANINPFGWWYFEEFSWVFLFGSVIVAFINKLDEKTFAKVFIEGCEQLLGLCLVLSVARGVSLLMGDKEFGMSLTFVYWIQSMLSNVPAWAFVLAATLTYVAIALFLQSTSGVAGITMPILGAVATALFAGQAIGAEGGQVLLISSFTIGINFTCMLYPESTIMGILALSNIPFDIYLKLMLKSLLPMLVAGALILSVAPLIGLV